jgi:Zn-dependent peptidase ImmA (M78 family)
MQKKKLDSARTKRLHRVLRSRLRGLGNRPLLGVLREIGRRFGISAQAVRYHAHSIGLGSKRGPGRPPKEAALANGSVIRALVKKAREHRRMARELARRHDRLARKYESMAASLTSMRG